MITGFTFAASGHNSSRDSVTYTVQASLNKPEFAVGAGCQTGGAEKPYLKLGSPIKPTLRNVECFPIQTLRD